MIVGDCDIMIDKVEGEVLRPESDYTCCSYLSLEDIKVYSKSIL